MDDISLYDDREDLRVYDEFEESGFLERHAYSDLCACMDFAEREVVLRGRYVEPLANIALGRDFMDGKVTKEDLADHRDRTWRNAIKLSEPDNSIDNGDDLFHRL